MGMSCRWARVPSHLPSHPQGELTLTRQVTQASRCDSGTATKIQQAQVRGAAEQAAQGLIAHEAAGGASEAELLKVGEAWARSPHASGRFGQPHQVQQPQHLGARPRLQVGRA